jgi:hypothetical protein
MSKLLRKEPYDANNFGKIGHFPIVLKVASLQSIKLVPSEKPHFRKLPSDDFKKVSILDIGIVPSYSKKCVLPKHGTLRVVQC